MMEKLQEAYDTFIKMSNTQFVLSEEDYMKQLHRELLSKAEAFESAADHLWSKFPNYITPTTTMRFNSIREHHLEDEASQERGEPTNQTETDLP